MKCVLILTNLFPDQADIYSGTFVHQQLKGLLPLVKLKVIKPILNPLPRKKFAETRLRNGRIPKFQLMEGIPVYFPRYLDMPRWSKQLNALTMLLSTLRCAARWVKTIDLIHCHFAYPCGYVGFLLARLIRKPIIISVWGSDINVIADEKRPQYGLERQRIICTLNKCNRVIAVSNALRATMIDLGIDGEKISVIHSGVDRNKFQPLCQLETRKILELPLDKKIVLYVGNLVAIKGLSCLMEAIHNVRDRRADFVLVMVGSGDLRNKLEQKAVQLGVDGHVQFVGRKAHDEIPLWMNACDTLVLPSLNEGFPSVILEALACGKPVVASEVGGIPEIIRDRDLGILVGVGNSQELAEAIGEALDKKWEPEKMLAYVRPYSWKRVAQRIYDEYQSIS